MIAVAKLESDSVDTLLVLVRGGMSDVTYIQINSIIKFLFEKIIIITQIVNFAWL